MKKRTFTLLALAMLIGGFSTLKAQTISSLKLSTNDGTNYLHETRDSEKPLTLNVGLIVPVPATDRQLTLLFEYNDTAAYLGIPESYTIYQLDTASTGVVNVKIPLNTEWNMPNAYNGGTAIIEASIKGISGSTRFAPNDTLYNYPTFNVVYQARTAQFPGLLEIRSITGSKPGYKDYMNRHLSTDSSSFQGDTISVFTPFTSNQVANLVPTSKIIVTTKWGGRYVVDIPGLRDDEGTPGGIPRAITIPVISDAILSVDPGVRYVQSGTDFQFTITPIGSNEDLVPVVTTGRTNYPDSEGVIAEKQADGSWLITIKRVQSAINLSVDFVTSNASIESNNVWANGSQLYINAATSANANVYSITGALVKSVNVAAGETVTVNLPKGLYVVSVNGKAYKVTVK